MTQAEAAAHAPSGASSRGSHQLSCVQECPERYKLRYIDKLRTKVEPSFRLGGTLVHDAIGHLYAERMLERTGTTPSWWTGHPLDQVLEQAGQGYPELIRNAHEVYDAYKAYWWGQRNEDWAPVAIEEEFRAKLSELDPDPANADPETDDETVTCRTDLVVRSGATGALVVVDHKTKATEGRTGKLAIWRPDGEFRISWQAMVNLHILRVRYPGEVVVGFVINRMSRREPYDFDRHLLRISPSAYNEVPSVLRRLVKAERGIIADVSNGGRAMKAFWSCYGRYGPCDYVDLCDAATQEDADAVASTRFSGPAQA